MAQRKRVSSNVASVDVVRHRSHGKVWGIFRCNPCNDTTHEDCMCGSCQCPCRTAQARKPKVKLDKSLLQKLPDVGTMEIK